MDFISKILIGLLSSVSLISNGCATPIVCDQEYALCTSARCIPSPDNSARAICDCVVEQGKSVGFKSCEERKPLQKKYGVKTLISTFSFEQFATKRPMNCPKGLPWTNCVDMLCTVDPQNAKRALCSCNIENTQAFFTFGGNCNTNTCATGFWSGATTSNGIILRDALMQVLQTKPETLPEACASES